MPDIGSTCLPEQLTPITFHTFTNPSWNNDEKEEEEKNKKLVTI